MVSVSVIVADLDVSLGSVKSELQHVDLYLLDEDRRVLYRFPTTPGQNAFIIQGEHEFSLPIGTRRMVFRVDVTYRKSFLRIERELKTRFYGDGSMLPADVIEPGSYTYRHTTKKKSVQLMNDLNNKAGFVVFRMYINPQSQPCAMRLDTGRVDHPMLDEIKMWIEIIRAINTRYTTHGFGICLRQTLCVLDTLWSYWLKEFSYDSSLVETSPSNAFDEFRASRGNVHDDLARQMVSHLRCLLDEVLPCVEQNPQLEPVIHEYTRDLLRYVLQTSIVLYSWAGIYPETTYFQLEKNARLDTLVRDILEISYEIMEKSVPIRFRILQAAYPDSFLQNAGSPDSNITATLYNAALQETIDNKPRICANALYSMRGQQATDTMGLIQNDLSLTLRDAVPRRRDAMRRMLTHMAQESNSLPSSLLVPAESTLHAVDGGAYGTIDVGSLYGKKVAMKAIRIYPRTGNTLSRLRQMYLEVLTCQSLSSPRVIQLYGISESRGMAWIVIPYFSRGNAIGYLARVRGSPVYQNGGLVALVNKWIFHLADGMRYLHEEGIVHGDIRGVNLLIDDAEGALIGDFGLSIFANGESKQYWSRRSGSMQWLAPEVMGQSESTSSRPTRDSDVYSFSHVCVELYTGQPPYRFKGTDIKDSELRYIIISQKQRPPLPAIDDLSNLWPMDEKLYELLQRCWDEKPENRPQMVNVVHSLQDLISM